MSTGVVSVRSAWPPCPPPPDVARWIYYSSTTGNTARLLANAGLSGLRIPRNPDEAMPAVDAPFILLTPSFGDATGKGAVPKAVIRFLNAPERRQWLRAVVGCGDRNFGTAFAQAGEVIARKCHVPLLHRVEMAGTSSDWLRLQTIEQHPSLFSTSSVTDAAL